MLFNSAEFILIFLPVVLIVYHILNKLRLIKISTAWLIMASLYFYSSWNINFLPVIITSMLFNYSIGSTLTEKFKFKINKKYLLIFGIAGNLLILGYYKYFDFLIQNFNYIFHQNFNLMNIIMPLAISFFTFQQVAYLVDSYNGKTKNYDFLTYCLFITFFPRLMQGPITRAEEMMPQFYNLKTKVCNWKNLSLGLFLFAVGLFKKVVFADMLSKWVVFGFQNIDSITFLESLITVFSYTFQIYFDFSGYTDMALGIGLMFNIKIPQNFNNPYAAIDIQDFWRRWHMTLSRCLKDYVYIPLGGNRKGSLRTYINVFLVFLICGIWHGANWTYILWGIMHGIASIINRLYKLLNIELPHALSRLITLIFVSVSWIYFSSPDITTANKMFFKFINILNFDLPKIYGFDIRFRTSGNSWEILPLVVLPLMIFFVYNDFFRNKLKNFKPNTTYSIYIVFMLICAFYQIFKPDYSSSFIYFQF
ncbi:MAG: MBOAT family O-acyltransferase [Candidatus Gastranaerophilaceae bacterium]